MDIAHTLVPEAGMSVDEDQIVECLYDYVYQYSLSTMAPLDHENELNWTVGLEYNTAPIAI